MLLLSLSNFDLVPLFHKLDFLVECRDASCCACSILRWCYGSYFYGSYCLSYEGHLVTDLISLFLGWGLTFVSQLEEAFNLFLFSRIKYFSLITTCQDFMKQLEEPLQFSYSLGMLILLCHSKFKFSNITISSLL